MKKPIIFLVLPFLLLTACSTKVYTPVIPDEFTQRAEVRTGDFSYSCTVVKTPAFVSITPTSTYAAGMQIKCDGKTVTFCKDAMKYSYEKAALDVTNPAIILYEVLYSLGDAQAVKKGELFEYSGIVSAGRYVLCQTQSGQYASLVMPDAGITVTFLQDE